MYECRSALCLHVKLDGGFCCLKLASTPSASHINCFDIFANSLTAIFRAIHVNDQIVNALPIAILRPFNSAGSRGFLLDAMYTYGADSFTGRLGCVFQCAAETTFYVIAVYFGSVKIKNTRYALSTMLLVDLICVFAAIFVCVAFFAL